MAGKPSSVGQSSDLWTSETMKTHAALFTHGLSTTLERSHPWFGLFFFSPLALTYCRLHDIALHSIDSQGTASIRSNRSVLFPEMIIVIY